MPAKPAAGPLLTLRQLNRAMLERQMLLRRERVSPVRAIERLGALQAQWAPAPYIALWSRVAGFTVAQLERAIADHRVVKATLMRGTLHLVSAADYPFYAALVHEARRSQWSTSQRTLMRFFATLSPAARQASRQGHGIGDPSKMHAALLRFART